ncbi:MAG TPA: phage major capsid protein [Pyrinomonadaceae bacterium]|nr:phage major capsid protein [Pyrinomonadaceae bacterium]
MTIKKTATERLAEIKTRGLLQRVAEVESVDEENRTVTLAFSSENPVRRWFGDEKLSHDPKHVRMDRINSGGALLWNHNWDDQRGVVESAKIEKDKKGRAVVRFSKTQDGEDLFQDVKDGIKRNVSVGYMVHGLKLVEERDNVDHYLVDDWEPYEISIVSVPADTTVGVGRTAEIPQEENPPAPVDTGGQDTKPAPETRKPETMIKTLRDTSGNLVRAEVNEAGEITKVLETLEVAGEAARTAEKSGSESERKRVRAINAMSERFGKSVDDIASLTRKAIDDGKSESEFQADLIEAMDKRMAKPLNDQAANADVGMTEKEVRKFSLLNVVRALADPTDRGAQKAAEFEFECSRSAAEKNGKSGERFVIPTDVLRHAVGATGTRVFNTGTDGGAPGNTGGFGIETTLQTASFIDILRNRATIMKLGRVLGGLKGNIDIPKQTAAAQGYWLGEDDDASETGIELGQLSLTPKTVAAFTEITRKLMMQSSLDVEAMLRSDLALALALTIDKAGYYGSGSAHQPMGIANQTGINAVPFAAANPTFGELVDMETAIALDNADVNGMKYVSNAGFRGYAKQTLKFSAAGSATLWEPGGTVNGYGCEITNQVNSGDVFFGNFMDLIIALWGGLEITVDPYSNSKKGRLRIVAFQDVDFALRRTESFCLGRPA